MLARMHRLVKKSDFERVFAQGKTARSPLMVCRFAPNGLAHSRLGFVVSKKVSNLATARNLARRRMRSAARRALPSLCEGHDIVVVALPAITGASFKQVCGAFDGMAKTLNPKP